VAGKTIGDLTIDHNNQQHLTVYGGFTPAGSQIKGWGAFAGMLSQHQKRRKTI
jgi:hypothetical protein